MAATTDLVLKNLAAANVTFTPSIAIPDGYQYRNLSLALPSVGTLDVKHKFAALASTANSTHTVRIATVGYTSAGLPRMGYVEVKISHPRDGVTLDQMRDMNAEMVSLMTDTNFQNLLLGKF